MSKIRLAFICLAGLSVTSLNANAIYIINTIPSQNMIMQSPLTSVALPYGIAVNNNCDGQTNLCQHADLIVYAGGVKNTQCKLTNVDYMKETAYCVFPRTKDDINLPNCTTGAKFKIVENCTTTSQF